MSTSAAIFSPEISRTPAWKAELNARLNAHRTRQKAGEVTPETTRTGPRLRGSGASPVARAMAAQVAARVAERYARAPSYSEVLAARAVAAAEAAHHAVAAAQQAHEAAQSFLSSVAAGPEVEELIDSAKRQDSFFAEQDPFFEGNERVAVSRPSFSEGWAYPDPPNSVAHPEPLPVRSLVPEQRFSEHIEAPEPRFPDPKLYPALDVVAEATVAPALPLLTKLIEFPRELVAPRKSRPRLAEGPLIEDEVGESAQLRIFEVTTSEHTEAAAMRKRDSDPKGAPRYAVPEAPEWHSIRLGEHPEPLCEFAQSENIGCSQVGIDQNAIRRAEQSRERHSESHAGIPVQARAPLHPASIEDRVIAGIVDLAMVGIGFLVFVLLFSMSARHLAVDRIMLLTAACALAGMSLLYQWLFMSYGSGTPGMRYAQIALCTFEDNNPVRKALRVRVGATLMAVLPLGLGLLWALFDEDRLGWHDRMTRTYQRSYK